jgi:hypothetical protein
MKLVRLTVIENASQKNVTGAKNWAVVKQAGYVTVEATTAPKNEEAEWKNIKFSGDKGEEVKGKPNRRKYSLDTSRKIHVEASLGGGSESLDIWVVWASVEIKTKGKRPGNAAPFDKGSRDDTDNLGEVQYKSVISSVIDEDKGIFVDNMGASGKVAPVATLTPKGVNKVLEFGWAFERQVWSHNWMDGLPTKQTNQIWTRDTSQPQYLKLKPDSDDRIYDLDAPDVRWGAKTYETYNNFRQWIEWNGTKCSDYALWYWKARWVLNQDMKKQITLNKVDVGNMTLPDKPTYPPPK